MRKLFLGFIFLLFTTNAFASGPVFDAKSNGTVTSGALTIAHTCTGSNLTLLVYAVNKDNVTGNTVTYNGVSMTEISTSQTRASMRGSWFYLQNPATGTHNIVITWGNTITIGAGAGISYTNAGIPDVLADSNGIPGGSGTQTTSITTLTDNSMIVAAQSVDQDWGSVAAQSPLTSRYDAVGGGIFSMNLSVGDYLLASHGAQAVGFNVIGSESYVQEVISLPEYVAPVNTKNGFFGLMA